MRRSIESGQYRAIRYTQRLAEADAVASVGSKGDSFDNAMAEALNSLYKAELVRGPVRRRKGPWRGIDDLEIGTAEWVDWYNQRRLHGELGHIPPAEYEAAYWATHSAADEPQTDAVMASHAETDPALVSIGTN